MIDEFIASIEGLKDELTGLLSKKMFRSRYALADRKHADSAMTAVLFRIEFDRLSDRLGPQTALEILKTLGEYVNKHFGPLGGFSARHSRGRILTMVPYLQPEEAERSVHDFALELQQKALPGSTKGIHESFEIAVTAGITEAGPADDIEQIIEKASRKQKIIATYQCGKEDCSK